MKILIFLACILSISNCLYEYQAGSFDWRIKNIGLIDSVSFYQDSQIYFTVKDEDNSLGSINAKNGAIEYLKMNPSRLLEKNLLKSNELSDISVLYDHLQNKISFFSLKTGVITKSIAINSDYNVTQVYTPSASEFIIVATIKEIIVIDVSERQSVIYSSNESENIVKVWLDKNQKIWFVVNNEKEEKIYIKYLTINKSLTKVEGQLTLAQTINLFNSLNAQKLFIKKDNFIYEENDNIIHIYLTDKNIYFKTNNIPKSSFVGNSLIKFSESDSQINFYQIVTLENSNKYSEVFSLEKKKNIKYCFEYSETSNTNSKESLIIGKIENNIFEVSSVNLEKSKILTQIFSKKLTIETGNIKNLWVGNSNSFYVLAQTEDLQTLIYSSKEDKILWNREDSLAYIEKTYFVNIDDIESKKVNEYYESLDNEGIHNLKLVVNNFIYRIKSEIDDIVIFTKNIFYTAFEQIRELGKSNNLKDALKILNKFGDNSGYEIFYNLKKIIIVLTKFNTLYGIDSQSGQIIWRKFLNIQLEDIKYYKGIEIYSLESKHDEIISNSIIIVFYSQIQKNIMILNISPLDGQIINTEFIPMNNLHKIIKIPAIKHHHNEVLLIIDEHFKLKFYPPTYSNYFKDKENHLYLYFIDSIKKTITGHKINSELPFWNINLSQNEEILKMKTISSHNKDYLINSLSGIRIAIHEDKKVLFKHINYNNFAVLTKMSSEANSQIGSLNLYIINGLTGRILFNQFILDVSLDYPIDLIVDDNAVFVTYYNQKIMGFEIWVVESYLNKMETSFTNMLEKYYFKYNPEDEIINYNVNDLGVFYLQQKYGVPFGVKYFKSFISKNGITRKNLIFITDKNQIYSMDRSLLSTRRPLKSHKENLDLTNSFESVELPPYQYNLPINFFSFISYFLDLNDLKEITFSPTNLESTSLLLAFGRDVFFSKISPDNTYDKLNEDFKYFYLLGTVLTVVFLTIFMKGLAKKTKIFQNFNRS